MDTQTINSLQSTYMGLTMAQRWCLKAIVEGRTTQLIEPECQGLVALGLLRRSGISFVATNSGCYVATLL